jgi:hypothetical protein
MRHVGTTEEVAEKLSFARNELKPLNHRERLPPPGERYATQNQSFFATTQVVPFPLHYLRYL